MKLKNNSTRLHWLGEVSIAPGEEKEVDDVWANAYNKNDLSEVKDEPKRGRPAASKPAQSDDADE